MTWSPDGLDIDSVRAGNNESDQTAPAQLFKLGGSTSSKFWFRLARYFYYQIIARDRLRAQYQTLSDDNIILSIGGEDNLENTLYQDFLEILRLPLFKAMMLISVGCVIYIS